MYQQNNYNPDDFDESLGQNQQNQQQYYGDQQQQYNMGYPQQFMPFQPPMQQMGSFGLGPQMNLPNQFNNFQPNSEFPEVAH